MQALLDLLSHYGPIVLSVLAALGLKEIAAKLIHRAAGDARAAAAKSPGKLDDVVVGVLADLADNAADLLEKGDLAGAKAALAKAQGHLGGLK